MYLLRVFFMLIALPSAFAIWSAICLARNYAKARTIGLPITIRFITSGGLLWMMFSPLVLKIASYVPFTGPFIATYRRGWEGRVRSRPHEELGDLFVICSPGGNWLKVCNAGLASEILKRKDEFGRDLEAFEVMNVYGKNLATTEGADWNRHRKVAAVTFTEKNNELVWRESVKEGSQMLEYWLYRSPTPIRTLGEDTRVFTLNVLAAALFDKSYPFESREESKARERREGGTKDHAFGYRDSLSTILRMIVPILVFGERNLCEAWWVPGSLRKAGHAVSDFRTYVTELINEERQNVARGKQTSPNLVTNLVRACEEGDGSLKMSGSAPQKAILTKDEIISDLFVFAFAGNDTTALTLTFIIGEMAANPGIQDWISEELRYYLPDDDISTWTYDACAKLKRCWAVVYETLRISHPLSQLCKTTGASPRELIFNDNRYIIPANTAVEINMSALHTHHRHWGVDSLSWNPRRFINTNKSSVSLESEQLPPDTTACFFPWAFGRNVCPGKRFSQVELVSVIAALFRDHVVEPVPEHGESMKEARRRVGVMSEDLEMRLLNEIRESEKLGLRWKPRNRQ